MLATLPQYAEKITREGVDFHPVRPDLREWGPEEEWIGRAMDLRSGSEFVVRELVIPHLRESYEDLRAASERADILVTHPLTFAGPIVAEKRQIPWVSTVLAPLGFFSKHDPPLLPGLPLLTALRALGPSFHGAFFGVMRRSIRDWTEPVRALRHDLGLPPLTSDPMFEAQFSPHGNLALFSSRLASPQPDWPSPTHVTGFPFYDRDEGTAADRTAASALERFLEAGPPPIVFTLGSSAVWDAGRFYEESLRAVRDLGERAVLLVGKDPRNRPVSPDSFDVHVAESAPYSRLFPRARGIVHQGGIGTTAQALRAGRPMLVVPFAHDQPDNADRVRRIGVGGVLARARYNAKRATAALRALLGSADIERKALEMGEAIRREDGADAACAAIEVVARG